MNTFRMVVDKLWHDRCDQLGSQLSLHYSRGELQRARDVIVLWEKELHQVMTGSISIDELPIESIGQLSPKAIEKLHQRSVTSIAELRKWTKEDLLLIPGIGKGTLNVIAAFLSKAGSALAEKESICDEDE